MSYGNTTKEFTMMLILFISTCLILFGAAELHNALKA